MLASDISWTDEGLVFLAKPIPVHQIMTAGAVPGVDKSFFQNHENLQSSVYSIISLLHLSNSIVRIYDQRCFNQNLRPGQFSVDQEVCSWKFSSVLYFAREVENIPQILIVVWPKYLL